MPIFIHKLEMIQIRELLKYFKKSIYSNEINSTVVISRLKLEERTLLAKITNVQSIDPKLTKVDSLIKKLEAIIKDLERIRVSSVIELSDDLRLQIEALIDKLYPVDRVLLMEYYLDKSLIAGFSFEAGGKYYDLSAKQKVISYLSL